jgi:hypothetical protein
LSIGIGKMAKGNNRAGRRGGAAELALRVVTKAAGCGGGAALLHPTSAESLLGEGFERGAAWLQKAGGSDAPLMIKYVAKQYITYKRKR